jgi:hypothetical protein
LKAADFGVVEIDGDVCRDVRRTGERPGAAGLDAPDRPVAALGSRAL